MCFIFCAFLIFKFFGSSQGLVTAKALKRALILIAISFSVFLGNDNGNYLLDTTLIKMQSVKLDRCDIRKMLDTSRRARSYTYVDSAYAVVQLPQDGQMIEIKLAHNLDNASFVCPKYLSMSVGRGFLGKSYVANLKREYW